MSSTSQRQRIRHGGDVGTPLTEPAGARGLLRRLDRPWTYRLITLVLFALGWQLTALWIGGLLLPTFTETMVALWELVQDPELWRAVVVSNQALFLGFGLAVLVGVPVGLAMGRMRKVGRFLDIYVSILLVMPMAAITPLLMMSVGIGLTARVILVFLFAVVMIMVQAQVGIRAVDPNLVEMARCYGATERAIWRKILLPSAMPALMTGVRIGIGRAINGMVFAELVMVSVGVGGMMLRFRGQFAGGALYAAVIVILVESLLLISAAQHLERRVLSWRKT